MITKTMKENIMAQDQHDAPNVQPIEHVNYIDYKAGAENGVIEPDPCKRYENAGDE